MRRLTQPGFRTPGDHGAPKHGRRRARPLPRRSSAQAYRGGPPVAPEARDPSVVVISHPVSVCRLAASAFWAMGGRGVASLLDRCRWTDVRQLQKCACWHVKRVCPSAKFVRRHAKFVRRHAKFVRRHAKRIDCQAKSIRRHVKGRSLLSEIHSLRRESTPVRQARAGGRMGRTACHVNAVRCRGKFVRRHVNGVACQAKFVRRHVNGVACQAKFIHCHVKHVRRHVNQHSLRHACAQGGIRDVPCHVNVVHCQAKFVRWHAKRIR
ncbi:uncharacterized protein CMC5_049510 [Chondromyces crocatus]|uniref:Uncharacterized protein n=1 Tax=Chondromyces crocatus TaxID=52 RepID=A0A0K1EIV7_CHOCO|nr:uncharacterized protein CMC5_049510 [Chondromyces crocatus]